MSMVIKLGASTDTGTAGNHHGKPASGEHPFHGNQLYPHFRLGPDKGINSSKTRDIARGGHLENAIFPRALRGQDGYSMGANCR